MKCENCGAEYGARELKCPYCGTKNLTGAQWQQEEEHAQQRMRQEKSWAIRKAPIYVVNRVANVILLVSLALFVLSIVVVAILCTVEEIREEAEPAWLEELRKNPHRRAFLGKSWEEGGKEDKLICW